MSYPSLILGGLTGPSGRQTDSDIQWGQGRGLRKGRGRQKQGPETGRQRSSLTEVDIGSPVLEGCTEPTGKDQTAWTASGELQKTVRWKDKEAQGDRPGGCQVATSGRQPAKRSPSPQLASQSACLSARYPLLPEQAGAPTAPSSCLPPPSPSLPSAQLVPNPSGTV